MTHTPLPPLKNDTENVDFIAPNGKKWKNTEKLPSAHKAQKTAHKRRKKSAYNLCQKQKKTQHKQNLRHCRASQNKKQRAGEQSQAKNTDREPPKIALEPRNVWAHISEYPRKNKKPHKAKKRPARQKEKPPTIRKP